MLVDKQRVLKEVREILKDDNLSFRLMIFRDDPWEWMDISSGEEVSNGRDKEDRA